MKIKHYLLFGLLVLFFSCANNEHPEKATQIIEKTIAKACSGNCENVRIQFRFRGRIYQSTRRGGLFELVRVTADSVNIIRDVLSNEGFRRYRNDSLISIPDSMAVKYANSVNSVHYFMQLPYGLQADAVQETYLGTTEIKGQKYETIQVGFQQEGGGKDYEDKFLYWIHNERYTIDYFAYSYTTDGGGIRFREAINPRVLEGIRFVDYHNYKPKSTTVALPDLPQLFEEGELELLSTIENEDIRVTLLED